ncbi:AI-2E family transporter [Gymnodinialimonas hymeniacidonis]|uniref:AI-2E family transporter n=1 Tax=Gymnodinialimonas hymeniacidonis TaxID=3126508 RepID=UPI0034C6003C
MNTSFFSARIGNLALIALVVLMLFVILDQAQGLFAPIISAIVLGVVLAPFCNMLERWRIPSAAAAMMIMAVFLCAVALIYLIVEPTISEAIRNAPIIWSEMRTLFESLRGAVEGVQELQETVADALTDGEDPEADAAAVPVPNLLDALTYGPTVLGGVLIFVGTLYFFLATRRDVYARVARFIPLMSEALLRDAEVRVSRYFLSIALVNAGFGIAVMIVMSLLGMPQPIMWGLAAFLLNFVLYLGPGLIALSLLLVGVITFDGAMSVVPMAAFIFLNMIESQFVTPTFVGRQMALNPLMVFLSLVFWLWLWGPIGGLVAIPLLVWLRFILSGGNDDNVPEPAPLDEAA